MSSSAGPEVVDLAASAGLILDEWQQFCLYYGCAERPDGLYAAKDIGLVVSRQNGKGPHSLDTEVLTSEGWTTFAEIRPGCSVYGSDGKPVRVVAVSEVYRDEDCYRVSFADGSSHVVGGGHLWHVGRKGVPDRDLTTEYLASRVGGVRPDNGRIEYNWRVRCDAVVETPRASLPIDPYLFGYWLGDGTRTAAAITVGHEDREWVSGRLAAAGAEIIRVSEHDHGMALGLAFRLDTKMRDGFESRCRRLGVWGDKRIPEEYLTASVEQRKSLLAGLMDSDGSIATTNASPQVEFTTSLPGLADDFHRLARSLGVRVTKRVGRSSLNGVRKKDRARFLWTPAFNPFEMPRKAAKWTAPKSDRHELMSIVDIRAVPTVPVRCIQVDAEDGVYLVGRTFTPTHNSILEAIELADLFLLDTELTIHSAHLFETSKEAQLRLEYLIESTPDLDRYFSSHQGRTWHAAGQEGLELKRDGKKRRLKFKTRTKGGGRGLSGDRIIIDEAMYYYKQQDAALRPTLSARRNPQIWLTGSAGTKESEMFGKMRSTALKAIAEAALGGSMSGARRLFWAEWSIAACSDLCPKDCDEHDPVDTVESYAKANPGLGIRISVDHVEGERAMMDDEMFKIERLGVGDWPVDDAPWAVIPEDGWHARTVEDAAPQAPFVFGLDVTPDKSASCITVAGANGDGNTAIEITSEGIVLDHRPGTNWVVKRVIELWKRWKAPFVIDKATQAGAFVDELEESGVKLLHPTGREYAQACGMVYSAVVPTKGNTPNLVHRGQPTLTAAVSGAAKRDLADMWAWDRRNATSDISPLVSATLAWWGLSKTTHKRKSKPKAAWG